LWGFCFLTTTTFISSVMRCFLVLGAPRSRRRGQRHGSAERWRCGRSPSDICGGVLLKLGSFGVILWLCSHIATSHELFAAINGRRYSWARLAPRRCVRRARPRQARIPRLLAGQGFAALAERRVVGYFSWAGTQGARQRQVSQRSPRGRGQRRMQEPKTPAITKEGATPQATLLAKGPDAKPCGLPLV
jgi:hypothetical protein